MTEQEKKDKPATRRDRGKFCIFSVDSSGNFRWEGDFAGVAWNEEEDFITDWVEKKGVVGKTYQGMRARTRQYALKSVTVKKVVPFPE